jgi:hypothetical protein
VSIEVELRSTAGDDTLRRAQRGEAEAFASVASSVVEEASLDP